MMINFVEKPRRGASRKIDDEVGYRSGYGDRMYRKAGECDGGDEIFYADYYEKMFRYLFESNTEGEDVARNKIHHDSSEINTCSYYEQWI